jgi:hypothetical protein
MSGNRQSITVNEMSTQRQLVKELYRLHTPWYDSVAAPALGSSFQHEAVSYLRLKPGDVVVDVACGTGSTFNLIKQKIGDTVHKGLSEPWGCLERFVSNLNVNVKAFGTIYVAFGTVAINGRAA